MSLISGLFTLPVRSAFQAYKQARFEFPLEKSSMFGPERIHKTDPRYTPALNSLPGAHIKPAMQTFLDGAGIRKDLIFVETAIPGFCAAAGTNMFTKGDAAVIISPGFYEADRDACSWVMKHEISHIRHNDLFTKHLEPCICQLAASIFGMCALSVVPAVALAFTVGIVSFVLFSRWREGKADDFAIENSSIEELKGGKRFLTAIQETSIEERNTFWKRVRISSSGNDRLDILHPSLTSRIQKIERTLLAKNAKIDPEIEKEKLNKMKGFLAEKKREIEQCNELVEL